MRVKKKVSKPKEKAEKPADKGIDFSIKSMVASNVPDMPDYVEEHEKRGPPAKALLLENKVHVRKGYEEIAERSFGKESSSGLELSYVEAIYLLERGRITLEKAGKKLDFNALMHMAVEKDPRIHEKYAVYRDLRSRGLVVKTGFKFGCDFRVYQRGVGVRRGPKSAGEHTKWIVFTVPEDYTCAFQELSRAVRLAHSIRARMLWAIVDNENDITYYEVIRVRP